MGEFLSAQINPHMTPLMRQSEKDQVARPQPVLADRSPGLHLQGRGPWDVPAEYLPVYSLDKPRAVDSLMAGPAHPVRRSFPLPHLGTQPLFQGRGGRWRGGRCGALRRGPNRRRHPGGTGACGHRPPRWCRGACGCQDDGQPDPQPPPAGDLHLERLRPHLFEPVAG